jgi:hypothetical protein
MGKIFIKVKAKAIWHLMHRRKAFASEKQCSVSFDLLPLEIIRHIASFMPANSAAALALCNHGLSRALGGCYWNLLSSDPEEGAAFLQCLERDLPEHLFCDRCVKLHLHCGPGKIGQNECAMLDRIEGTSPYYHPWFQFEHVQMAMKLHRSGRDTKAYLAQLAPVDATIHGSQNIYLFEARIAAHEFFVRAQHWFFVPGSQVLQVPEYTFDICYHLKTDRLSPSVLHGNKLRRMLSCKIQHLNDDQEQVSCETCGGLRQCSDCPTEFQIDLKSFCGRGTAVVITKWMNLGAGRSRSDPKWRSHLRGISGYKKVNKTVPYDPAARRRATIQRLLTGSDGPFEFESGSVRAAFEQRADFAFESLLTPKNVEKLLQATATNNIQRTWITPPQELSMGMRFARLMKQYELAHGSQYQKES